MSRQKKKSSGFSSRPEFDDVHPHRQSRLRQYVLIGRSRGPESMQTEEVIKSNSAREVICVYLSEETSAFSILFNRQKRHRTSELIMGESQPG